MVGREAARPFPQRLSEVVMSLLSFRKTKEAETIGLNPEMEAFLKDYSIEVMPRTAAKVEDFRDLLPAGTRVYIAHIEGTPIEDMVATAKRLSSEGYKVMPHFPARIIKDEATLADWIARYQGEAGVDQALLLAQAAGCHPQLQCRNLLLQLHSFDFTF